MAEYLEALVIYDSRLFYPGSHVSRWAGAVHRNFVANAIEAAPMRSGELRAGIHGDDFRSGAKHWTVEIFSSAPHTMFVLKGTTGPIMSRRYFGFKAKFPHLRAPRGGMIDPTRPHSTQLNMGWMHANGYALKVRAGNGYPQRFALSVSGQEANNFMADAAHATARRHSSLRGWDPGYGF